MKRCQSVLIHTIYNYIDDGITFIADTVKMSSLTLICFAYIRLKIISLNFLIPITMLMRILFFEKISLKLFST